MSIRFDAAGDFLQRTTDLPAADPLSLSFWLYLTVDRNAEGTIFILTNAGGTEFSRIILDTDGTTIQVDTQTSAGTNGSNLSTATWYHVGYTRAGADHALYLNGVSDITRSDNNAVTTPANLLFGSNSVTFINGRVGNIKIWTAQLTQAEIQAEITTWQPVRYANLHLWTPNFPGATERLADWSGNGRNWTGNGTLADEDPPPLIYKTPSMLFIPPAVVAAGGHPMMLRGTGVPGLRHWQPQRIGR